MRHYLIKNIIKEDFNKRIIIFDFESLYGERIEARITGKEILEIIPIIKRSALLFQIFRQIKRNILNRGYITAINGIDKEILNFYKKNKLNLNSNQLNILEKVYEFLKFPSDYWYYNNQVLYKLNITPRKLFRFLEFFNSTILFTNDPISNSPFFIHHKLAKINL
jgi:hypothetical protein